MPIMNVSANTRRLTVDNLLGAKIRELRKAKGLTLEKLAEKIGSGKSYICGLERGWVQRPSAEKLAAIARALGTSTEFLIDNGMTEPTDEMKKAEFFRRLERLSEDEQQKIADIIDAWSK